MGLNSVAVLFNDFCGEIANSGRLGQRISFAMQEWNPVERKGFFGAGRVISRDHSDGYQVVIVHGNTGQVVQDANDLPDMPLRQMAECLIRHGWTARPPKKTATRVND